MLNKRTKKGSQISQKPIKQELVVQEFSSTSRRLHRSTSRSKSRGKMSRDILKRVDTTDNTLKHRVSTDKVSHVRQLTELQSSYASLLQKQTQVQRENSQLRKQCSELREKYHECQESKLNDQLKIKYIVDENRQTTNRLQEELEECKRTLRGTEEKLHRQTAARMALESDKSSWLKLKSKLFEEYSQLLEEIEELKTEWTGSKEQPDARSISS